MSNQVLALKLHQELSSVGGMVMVHLIQQIKHMELSEYEKKMLMFGMEVMLKMNVEILNICTVIKTLK